ncbi:MAG: 37S ribosomal protein S23 mitochondrial [Phylliscum demangeonii]|nr:MAG: 37S ribosomal protein S23 mitochondrial [Phylliscum demangeonii]
MALARCWSCLRPVVRASTRPRLVRWRTMTLRILADGRPSVSFRKKKKDHVAAQKNARPPARGERKALRKRIVLSNANALEVRGLHQLTGERGADVAAAQGRMAAIPAAVQEQLRVVRAFRTTQRWSAFRAPATLLTSQSVRLIQEMESVEESADDGSNASDANEAGAHVDGDRPPPRTFSTVFTGERATGKSTMLLLAMTLAFLKRWIVVNVPECQELTMAHTDYAPVHRSTTTAAPVVYVQKKYMSALLLSIAQANEAVLSTLHLEQPDRPLPAAPRPGQTLTLHGLAMMGANDADIAWDVFEILWAEMARPTTTTEPAALRRPPILLAMDGLSHLMRLSYYRSPDFHLIHAHDLLFVDHLMRCLSGAEPLPNGGAVLAATSRSNVITASTFDVALRQAEARVAGEDPPEYDPFRPRDDRVAHVMRHVHATKLAGVTRDETRTLLEYYAASGLLRARVDDRQVAEKWSLAGGGVLGEVERAAVAGSWGLSGMKRPVAKAA